MPPWRRSVRAATGRSGKADNSKYMSPAWLATAEGSQRFAAPSVCVQSQVGAGDSMLAGVVLGLARGMALQAAVRLGIAAGTAATLEPGTQLCTREETERLLGSRAG